MAKLTKDELINILGKLDEMVLHLIDTYDFESKEMTVYSIVQGYLIYMITATLNMATSYKSTIGFLKHTRKYVEAHYEQKAETDKED